MSSQKIIKHWFEKVMTEDLSSDKFIALWTSFNGFYVAEFYNKVKAIKKGREPNDGDYIKYIIEKGSYSKRYSELINNEPKFKKYLDNFIDVLNSGITHYPGKIADMRPSKETEQNAKEFSICTNYEQFIRIIYQIRCNLFHGNKSPYDEGDKKIIEGIFNPFYLFVKEIYELEGYLI